jgi:hypothetical protein
VLVLPSRLTKLAVTADKEQSYPRLVTLLGHMARGQEVRITLGKARHNKITVGIASDLSILVPTFVSQVASVRIGCDSPVLGNHSSCRGTGADVSGVVTLAVDGTDVEWTYRTVSVLNSMPFSGSQRNTKGMKLGHIPACQPFP